MTQTTTGGDQPETMPAGQVASDEDQYRSGAYAYLAALLRAEPDDALLEAVAGLGQDQPQGAGLEAAISLLGLAAKTCQGDSVREEYFNLFIGLGRGELVPFGSWYQTGFLMERPLGVLRDDLAMLGFERDPEVKEPEDHIGALFEVMAMLINEATSLDQQKVFFERHLSGWVTRFFGDLTNARAATFYQSVARFGTEFMEFEKRYLGMPV